MIWSVCFSDHNFSITTPLNNKCYRPNCNIDKFILDIKQAMGEQIVAEENCIYCHRRCNLCITTLSQMKTDKSIVVDQYKHVLLGTFRTLIYADVVLGMSFTCSSFVYGIVIIQKKRTYFNCFTWELEYIYRVYNLFIIHLVWKENKFYAILLL